MKRTLLVVAAWALSLFGAQTVLAQTVGSRSSTEVKAECAAARKAGKMSTAECDAARLAAKDAASSTTTRAQVKANAKTGKASTMTEGEPSGPPAKAAPSNTTRAQVKSEAVTSPKRGKGAEGENKN